MIHECKTTHKKKDIVNKFKRSSKPTGLNFCKTAQQKYPKSTESRAFKGVVQHLNLPNTTERKSILSNMSNLKNINLSQNLTVNCSIFVTTLTNAPTETIHGMDLFHSCYRFKLSERPEIAINH